MSNVSENVRVSTSSTVVVVSFRNEVTRQSVPQVFTQEEARVFAAEVVAAADEAARS